MNFEQAIAAYVHRFTMEYVPAWAKGRRPADDTGSETRFYAPQYRSDREWFENTKFPPNNSFALSSRDTSCYSSGQTWPCGQWLDAPFVSGR